MADLSLVTAPQLVLSKPIQVTRNVVPYGNYKDKLIYADKEHYPFELTLVKPNELAISDISFANNIQIPESMQSMHINLVNSSGCSSSNNCVTIRGYLSMDLPSSLNYLDIESKQIELALNYKQGNESFVTNKVTLKIAQGVLIQTTDINLTDTELSTIKFNQIVPNVRYGIPDGHDSGVLVAYPFTDGLCTTAGSGCNQYYSANTIKLDTLHMDSNTKLPLHVFMIKKVDGSNLSSISLNSTAYNNDIANIQIWTNAKLFNNGSSPYFYYSNDYIGNPQFLSSSQAFELNTNLPQGTYRTNFYIYGQQFNYPVLPEQERPMNRFANYIKLTYVRN